MRVTIPINDQWSFFEEWSDQLIQKKLTGVPAHIPHAMKELSIHYPDERSLWIISGYQRTIEYNSAWEGKQVIIRFEGVMAVAEVFLNGQFLQEHKGGYTHWEVDLTEHLQKGDNLLTIKVDSRECDDVPPFGAQIDYLCYNGIYREVSMRIVDPLSIQDILLSQKNALTSPTITGHIRLKNTSKSTSQQIVKIALKDKNQELISKDISVTLEGSLFQDIPVEIILSKDSIKLWDLDSPYLYTVQVSLENDTLTRSFGFREASFEPDGFYLNGEKIKLRGLNRHQSFPYVGYAMPSRAQKKDADILKEELGLNLVRTSHYPQSSHFLDRCDEIGLLVFEEIPGWQHIGDDEWRNLSVSYVKDMIERDMHHPSIILWGVRINESSDHHDFYTKTNKMAKATDPTRQTGGVRDLAQSEFLEDVYTMNDFVQGHHSEALRGQKEVTGLDYYVPYMVTEYNGHMYPTKSYDQEERLIEHTNRHYKVLAASGSDDHISGCIGWCAFDYHTHFDFGSGDRICYHGVMDIFRNPKFAASAYRSQGDPKPFLQAITLWTRGERSIGGILPLMVSTNCDYIKAYYGDRELGQFFPAEGRYRGLAHPPIIVEDRHLSPNIPLIFQDEWGATWLDGRIEGYKDEKCVIVQKLTKAPLLTTLEIKADDLELIAPQNGTVWDTTRISILAKDQVGNRLPYMNAVVQISVEGGELIGDNLVALEGGSYAFWIKATQKQDIHIKIASPSFKTQTLTINVK